MDNYEVLILDPDLPNIWFTKTSIMYKQWRNVQEIHYCDLLWVYDYSDIASIGRSHYIGFNDCYGKSYNFLCPNIVEFSSLYNIVIKCLVDTIPHLLVGNENKEIYHQKVKEMSNKKPTPIYANIDHDEIRRLYKETVRMSNKRYFWSMLPGLIYGGITTPLLILCSETGWIENFWLQRGLVMISMLFCTMITYLVKYHCEETKLMENTRFTMIIYYLYMFFHIILLFFWDY